MNINTSYLWSLAKDKLDPVTQVFLNSSNIERKVRSSTNLESWGPSSTQMGEIAKATYNYSDFFKVMETLYQRFQETHWRHVYKSLLVLEYCLKNGSERVVDDVRVNIYKLRSLLSFQYIDEKKKDQGISVREKTRKLIDLVYDQEKLRKEREIARRNQGKYIGASATDARYAGIGTPFQQDYFNAPGRDQISRPEKMSNRELSYFSQEEGKTTTFSAQSESPPRRTNKALTITSRAREVQTFSREKEREASTSSAEEDEWGEFKCAVVSSAQPIRNSNAIDLLSTDFPVINGNERLFKHDIPTLDIVGGLVQQPFENGDDLDFIGPDLSSRPSNQLNVDLFATHKQPPTNRSADLRISPAELPLSGANITSRVPITHDARSSLISSQNAFDKQYSNRNSAFSDLVELNSRQSQKAEKSALSLNVLLNTKKQQPIDNNLS